MLVQLLDRRQADLCPQPVEGAELPRPQAVTDTPPDAIANAPEPSPCRAPSEAVRRNVRGAERRGVGAEDGPWQSRGLSDVHRAMAVDVDDQSVRLHLRDRLVQVGKLELSKGRVGPQHPAQRVDLRPPTPVVELELLDARVDSGGLDSAGSHPLNLRRSPAQMQLVTTT